MEEAAHYMCRSLSKFKQTEKVLHIPSFLVDGIKMYRKIDIKLVIENEINKWQLVASRTPHRK